MEVLIAIEMLLFEEVSIQGILVSSGHQFQIMVSTIQGILLCRNQFQIMVWNIESLISFGFHMDPLYCHSRKAVVSKASKLVFQDY